ncbi:MAG: helix-turn-helix domain-containing protein, partial [Candidatus Handelsmanbacteria bacterium]|nr:helix-turn-helix domain-containing protein [Candidatus Handelsmanbacteria bacterium]
MSEESIATKLRHAREQQGKTHEQLHRQLGLSLNVLQAVETGNFKVVEPIYMRMILKTYADHLGLDGAAILKQYNDQFGAPPPTLEVPPEPTPGPHTAVALGDALTLPVAPGTTSDRQPSPLAASGYGEPNRSGARGGLLILGGGALLLVLLLALYLADTRSTGEEPRTAPQARPPVASRPELAPQHPAQAPAEALAPP